jgi:hypothetical protein
VNYTVTHGSTNIMCASGLEIVELPK